MDIPSRNVLVPLLVLVMFLPSVLPVHASPVYTSGVSVGQWASYIPVNVTYHGTGFYSPAPQPIKDLNATVQFTATISQVYSPTNVTVQSVAQYKNTTMKAEILNGDLMTGAGNLTFGLIAGGLSSPDALWNAPYTPTINQTVSATYLGASRVVNVWNHTYTIPFGMSNAVVSLEYVWDQTSGITLEFKNLSVYPNSPDGGYMEYTHVRIQSTNIFSNQYSRFTVTSSNPASVTIGTSATSTIIIATVNGFSGTVALTDTVPSGLTCNAISPSTLTGHGTASLTCNSTTPGTYTVTITATSGSTTHTSTTTITVTAAPSQTPNAPATILGLAPTTFYTIIGVVILAIAATGAYLFLRTRSQEQQKTTTPMTAT